MAELEDINIEWKEFVDTSGFPLDYQVESWNASTGKICSSVYLANQQTGAPAATGGGNKWDLPWEHAIAPDSQPIEKHPYPCRECNIGLGDHFIDAVTEAWDFHGLFPSRDAFLASIVVCARQHFDSIATRRYLEKWFGKLTSIHRSLRNGILKVEAALAPEYLDLGRRMRAALREVCQAIQYCMEEKEKLDASICLAVFEVGVFVRQARWLVLAHQQGWMLKRS
ncbi:hypothetical protein XPA_006149 [Xanthoria parietina]